MQSGIRAITLFVAAGIAMLGATTAAAADNGVKALVGTFRITSGSCDGSKVAGSTFRMVLPSGTDRGPFVTNNDSACSDKSYTLLEPGSDGGLVTGGHQAEPAPGFD